MFYCVALWATPQYIEGPAVVRMVSMNRRAAANRTLVRTNKTTYAKCSIDSIMGFQFVLIVSNLASPGRASLFRRDFIGCLAAGTKTP